MLSGLYFPPQRPARHGFFAGANRLAAPDEDHIAASCSITRGDFDYAELAAQGGLQKAWSVFGSQLDALMGEMKEALVA